MGDLRCATEVAVIGENVEGRKTRNEKRPSTSTAFGADGGSMYILLEKPSFHFQRQKSLTALQGGHFVLYIYVCRNSVFGRNSQRELGGYRRIGRL